MACWWCCHKFEGQELHLPYKKDHTMGIFCSWECMKAFAMERFKTGKSLEVFTLITSMKKQITGKTTMTKAAPSRYSLKLFGGPLTIEEFRKNNEQHYKYVLPNEKYKIPIVVEQYRTQENQMTAREKSDKMLSIKNAGNSSNTLKLKREKPLKRDAVSTLEQSLGIVRKS